MSSDKYCCVPGCRESGGMHKVLHGFPNPEKEREKLRFNSWLCAIGGDILRLTNDHIYKYRRVCHSHFKDEFKCRNNRLSNAAIPTLNLSGLKGPSSNVQMLRTTPSVPSSVDPGADPGVSRLKGPTSDVQMLKTTPSVPSSVDPGADPAVSQNLKIWAAEPDVCRCCLSIKGSWDLLATNINDAGEKHVYSEILLSCFGISLSSLTEWGPGRKICDVCVTRLNDANTFRQQVLQAELQFVTYINTKQENDEVEHSSSPDEQTNQPDPIIDESIHKSASNEDITCSSEPELKQPIADKSTEITQKDSTSDVYDNDDDVDVASVPLSSVPHKPEIILISERKRIKATCETILRDTTACPFRHHRSWFQCFYCTQDFMEISSLRTHTNQAHDPKEEVNKLKRYPRSLQIDISEFSCKLCNLNLTDVESMRAHLKDAHKLLIYKECISDYKVNFSPFSCHLCGKEFHVFRTLTMHMNEHYANFICDVCGKSFINTKRLKVHNKTHESGNFPCTQCGKVLKTKTAVTNHLESHSKRVIKCPICSKAMKHYNERVKHMSEVHNITHLFKCPVCSREFNIRHYLTTHIRQTHGLRNKKCGECGMAFITNHGLKKHMKRHNSVKAYTCEVCSKVYARSHSLKEHMRIHHDNDQRLLQRLDLSIHRS